MSEAKAKLARLEEKQAEFEAQKQENSSAILQAERVIHIQKESTSAEVLKLKGADCAVVSRTLLISVSLTR